MRMDPVTHALSGIVLQQLGFKRKAALLVIVFSAIAPDLDYVTRIWGADVFLRYHRGITHGIFALLVFPLIMALLFGLKQRGFFYYYTISFIGYASHLMLDLTNQYGTRILSPLDWNRYALNLTFIVDPYITVGLLLGAVWGRVNKKRTAIISLAVVVLLSGYISGRAYLQDQAKRFLKTKVDANSYDLYPLPNGFLRWWFVAGSGEQVSTGFVDLFMQRAFIADKYVTSNNAPAIDRSKRSAVGQSFLYFSSHPYAEARNEHGRTVVIWKELSYSFLPGERFTAKVVMDGNGKILESGFTF
jgi:inner membrane protein